MNARFLNGSSRRRDTEPARRTVVKGVAVAMVFVAFGWLAVTAYNGVPGRQYTTMYADVSEVGNILEHDQVRIAGVRVGQVQARAIRPGGGARLTLQLEPGVTLPVDTRVALRASGLLGARYVQLVPGTSDRALASGATIQAPATALSYGVPEALDTFDAQTRGGLGTAVRELGTGLLGHGSRLNDAVRLSGGQMHRFQLLANSVLDRPGAARRLLPSLDTAVTPLDAARRDIADLFGPAATALQPFVDRRHAVRETLAQAPAALAAAQTGLTDGRRLLGATRALATSASRTLPFAPSGLRSATALLRESDGPLRRAASLLRDAGPAVPAALRITGSLSPLLRPLRDGFGSLVPMVTRLGRYGCDIENFGVVFRSMTGLGGTGEGPIGPAMAFRLQAIPPSAEELTGSADKSGLIRREGYPEPCKYLASPYVGAAPRIGNGAAR